MNSLSRHPVPLRVLLTEGASTSAREAVTVLGLKGHHVELCDPGAFGLARFSRFVRAWHRCPGLGDDPSGFLGFIEALVTSRRFDVLLPIHEQGLALSCIGTRLEKFVGVALPDFGSYLVAHDKARFCHLLGELALPQPATRIVRSAGELQAALRLPCVVKTAIGTASRGVWLLRDERDIAAAITEIDACDGFSGAVLVQAWVDGPVEKAQAVFRHGDMLGFHACRQLAEGAGGGDAIKQSVSRPDIRAGLAAIGERLAWHGALSVDCIRTRDGASLFIDCNPRLVEPMAAHLAGVDLVGLLLDVSRAQPAAVQPEGRAGLRTHQAMQMLLGIALRQGTRRDLARACWRMATHSGPFRDSTEELTPVRTDWPSGIPLAMTALILLVRPQLAGALVRRGFGAHLMTAKGIAALAQASPG